jgi:predicted molibdopterin-dependent oxidoreductase YjgC
MADVILVIGSNPNEELPIFDLRLKKAAFQRQGPPINCNAWKTPLDRLAKAIADSQPRGQRSRVAELRWRSWFTSPWTDEPAQSEALHKVSGEGSTAWIDSLGPYSSTRVAEIAGVDEGRFCSRAATGVACSERLFLFVGENASPATLQALQNLAALKGRSDYLVVLHPEANAVGVRRAGLVPGEGGLNGEQMLAAAFKGDIKVLYLAANNPLHRARDYEAAKCAIETVDFLVVQTLFLNELTEQADVVLPAATFLEQDGTTTNFHGKVQTLKQVFKPRERRDERGNTLSACAPDWIIFTKLLQLLGKDPGFTTASQWSQKFRALPQASKPSASSLRSLYEASDTAVSEGSAALADRARCCWMEAKAFPYLDRLKRVVRRLNRYINLRRTHAA